MTAGNLRTQSRKKYRTPIQVARSQNKIGTQKPVFQFFRNDYSEYITYEILLNWAKTAIPVQYHSFIFWKDIFYRSEEPFLFEQYCIRKPFCLTTPHHARSLLTAYNSNSYWHRPRSTPVLFGLMDYWSATTITFAPSKVNLLPTHIKMVSNYYSTVVHYKRTVLYTLYSRVNKRATVSPSPARSKILQRSSTHFLYYSVLLQLNVLQYSTVL